MKTIGFIGTGHMGGTLAKKVALKNSGDRILLANRTFEKAARLAEELNAELNAVPDGSAEPPVRATDNREVALLSDYIILGVVPQMMDDVFDSIRDVLKERAGRGERFVIVTMATGVEIKTIRSLSEGEYPIVRIMPNTPASIGEGLMLYARGDGVKDEEVDEILDFFSLTGRVRPIKESLVDVGSAVAACGPAFIYIFIEALADGAVLLGLSRDDAYEYAATMTAGAAKLMLETGFTPSRLKDEVCSPGGTTIEGVRTLEEYGFRRAVIDAVIATHAKNAKLRSGPK